MKRVSNGWINLNLIADQVVFEEDLADGPGGYVPGDQFPISITSDGETVTFHSREGRRFYCDRVDLLRIVADSRVELPSAAYGGSVLGTGVGGHPPGTRTEKNPPPARRRSPRLGVPPLPLVGWRLPILAGVGGALLWPWPLL